MTAREDNINVIVREVYNGSIVAVKKIIPIEFNINAPRLIKPPLTINFGVMIGFTGGLKGELVVTADEHFFGLLGEKIFGLPVSKEMLESFAGELGNMIAGSLSTHLAEKDIKTEITYPTVLKGDAKLSGFKRALLVEFDYENKDGLVIHLLLN